MLDFSEYQNQDCSLIFVEPVSEETYVDQDEMRKLDYMVRLERIWIVLNRWITIGFIKIEFKG